MEPRFDPRVNPPSATPRQPNAAARDDFFRWQYVHVASPSAGANGVLHDTDIFGAGTEPYVSVCHDASGVPAHARRRQRTLDFSEGDARFPGVEGVYRRGEAELVSLRAGKLGLFGQAQPRPGSALGCLTTTLLEQDGRKSHWQILTVGSSFAGCAVDGATQVPLTGSFYMDRQWGDLLLQDSVRDWAWGHIVGPRFELVYFDITTRRQTRTMRTLLKQHDRWHEGATISCSYLDIVREHRLSTLDTSLPLGVAGGSVQLSLKLAVSPRALLRLREDEHHQGFAASYARWRIDPERNDGLFGFTEYLRIDR